MNRNNEHGREMMSSELEAVVTQNNPVSENGISPYTLIADYKGDEIVSIPCHINTLSESRVDIEKIPAKTGLSIFYKFLKYKNLASYSLKTQDFTFQLGKVVTVYSFYDDMCSITFSVD